VPTTGTIVLHLKSESKDLWFIWADKFRLQAGYPYSVERLRFSLLLHDDEMSALEIRFAASNPVKTIVDEHLAK
ncbi:hypothetical protein, partial [Neisseria sicca]|uniref:hypothetical protein n=1 Tax=Neisseria sicca TaxID=490 RepID=UPI0028801141